MTLWAKFNKDHWNLPNALSFLRAVLGFVIPCLLIPDHFGLRILGTLLFIFAAITDYWDGWVARRQGLVSNLGKILDPTSDKILILCTFATFAHMGLYSPWWLVGIFFREITITFCRLGWLLEKKAIGAENLGKAKLVVQVITLVFPFLQILGRHIDVMQSMLPLLGNLAIVFLLLSNLLTLISGLSFVRSNRLLFLTPEFSKFVSAAGVGLLPGPTGTWGSLLALTLIPLTAWNFPLYILVTIFLFWMSWIVINRLDLSKQKDPHFVVMDEVVGIFFTFLLVPLDLYSLLTGFFLFRLFDIVKPFPCRQLEKLPGFWGIMMDDVFAGIYSCIVLHFLFQ